MVFHCRDLGLGVQQVGIGICGDHVAHGRLFRHFVGPGIIVKYRADGTAAEFITCLGGYAIHLFHKADFFKIPSADGESTVLCYALDLTCDLMYSGMSACIRSDRRLYCDARIGTPL